MKETSRRLFAITLVIVSLLAIVVIAPYLNEAKAQTQLRTFTSYEELRNFLNASQQRSYPPYDGGWLLGGQPGFFRTLSAGTFGEQSAVPDYSFTNVQVEGVDEADIVKTDGAYIYIVSGNKVKIIKAYPAAEAQVLSEIKLNGTLQGLFINRDRLTVIEGLGLYQMRLLYPEPSVYESGRTFIRVYDVTDRTDPVSARNVSVNGNYFNSRMIGDYVYAIINQPAYIQSESGEVSLPRMYFDGWSEAVPATEVYYSDVSDRFDVFTNVVALNLHNDAEEPTHKTFLLGWGSAMYVSQSNIYVTYSTYSTVAETTSIHRIHVQNSEITYEASGEVPGYVLNQFSMDEHNEHFRIATTTGHVGWVSEETMARNHVYILDMDLDIVGRLEDLAPGERIYSARFMGDRGYLVTFKKVDPLFVLDLSDPSAPRVLGQLKVTGYSDYLHPYDENHIIGVGKETIEAEEGDFAWYQGVKISLFDVTDVANPREIAKYEIGKRGTDSPVLRDHKAFLFDKSRNLLVLPVTVVEEPYSGYAWDGAYVFHISLEEGLVLRGKVTHVDNDAALKMGYYNYDYSVKRSLYIDNVLYTISDAKIKMNSLVDLSLINEINLNP